MGSEVATTRSRYTALSIGTNDGLSRMERIATVMASSGAFKDAKGSAQAFAKLVIGEELGVGPAAAMAQIFLFDGKVTFGASLIASQVKGSGRYRYLVTESSAKRCEIRWSEFLDDAWTEVGVSEFTLEEAKTAGLLGKDNWRKYPSDMLFARALTRGARRYCPDVFGGGSVYTPEEVGGNVDEDGNLIIDEAPAGSPPPPPDIPEDDGPALSPVETAKAAIVEARTHFGKDEADEAIATVLLDEFDKTFAELDDVEYERLADAIHGLIASRTADGAVVEDAAFEEVADTAPRAFQVAGSKGAEYTVTVHEDGSWDCSCPARVEDCRHVKAIRRPFLGEDGLGTGWLWPGDDGYDNAPPASSQDVVDKVERTLARKDAEAAGEAEADGAPAPEADDFLELIEMGKAQGLTDVEAMQALASAGVGTTAKLQTANGKLVARGAIASAANEKRKAGRNE